MSVSRTRMWFWLNSTSWVADGFDAFVTDKDGKKTPVPHFSDLFPGWEMPKN